MADQNGGRNDKNLKNLVFFRTTSSNLSYVQLVKYIQPQIYDFEVYIFYIYRFQNGEFNVANYKLGKTLIFVSFFILYTV